MAIKNQYVGKSGRQVWNEWNHSQRMHFIEDHTGKQHTPASIDEISKRNFRFIPSDVRAHVIDHIMTGQYESGGLIPDFSKEYSLKEILGL